MIAGGAQVMANLDNYIEMQKVKMATRMRVAMVNAENNSKGSAPWTDRTGNARNSIFGNTSVEPDRVIGYHGIGVEYGVYLELSNQGKYRVIWPTMDWLRPQFLDWMVS